MHREAVLHFLFSSVSFFPLFACPGVFFFELYLRHTEMSSAIKKYYVEGTDIRSTLSYIKKKHFFGLTYLRSFDLLFLDIFARYSASTGKRFLINCIYNPTIL